MSSIAHVRSYLIVLFAVCSINAELIRYTTTGEGFFLDNATEIESAFTLSGIMDIEIQLLDERHINHIVRNFEFLINDQLYIGSGKFHTNCYNYNPTFVCEFDAIALWSPNGFDMMDVTDRPIFYHADGTPFDETDHTDYWNPPFRITAGGQLFHINGNPYFLTSWEIVQDIPEPSSLISFFWGMIPFFSFIYFSKKSKKNKMM